MNTPQDNLDRQEGPRRSVQTPRELSQRAPSQAAQTFRRRCQVAVVCLWHSQTPCLPPRFFHAVDRIMEETHTKREREGICHGNWGYFLSISQCTHCGTQNTKPESQLHLDLSRTMSSFAPLGQSTCDNGGSDITLQRLVLH